VRGQCPLRGGGIPKPRTPLGTTRYKRDLDLRLLAEVADLDTITDLSQDHSSINSEP